MQIDSELRAELIAMAEEDLRVRADLVREGVLFDGYQPHMAAVHRRNAERLAMIMSARGWPGPTLVGEDGAHAAWLVLQHSIGSPRVMRQGLALLQQAVAAGEALPAEVATLEDRVRTLSGLPQRYGTQFDWDENGVMNPKPIEDPHGVDARRRAVGLDPLTERIQAVRAAVARERERPPADRAARCEEIAAWEREVGWHA